jgi:hypothetical protein
VGQEQGFIELIAEGDHLINGPIIRDREFAGLGETSPVFGVGIDDPVIDHIDVAFILFNEGQTELETIGELDHRVNDVARDRILIDHDIANRGASAVHHDEAIGFHDIQNAGFANQIVIAARAKEDFDSLRLHLPNRVNGALGNVIRHVREEGSVDIRENDFDVFFVFH